jgi:hypothetical protein
MNIPDVLPPAVKIKNKFAFKYILFATLGMVFLIVGFVAGKTSELGCNKFILGVQASNSISYRLASLFNFNLEKPSQQINTFQLAPTGQEPTVEPTPTTEDVTPSMIWSGTNRDPKPSPTPTPNNVITVPEPTVDDQVPTPTPKYKYDWGRNNPTPTPNNVIIEATAEATKSGVMQQPKKISIVPMEIQNLVEHAGVQMDKIQVTRGEGEKEIRVSGELRERLFGFLTVGYPISFKVDQDMGTIESASIPWWRSLFGNPFIGNVSKIRCGDGICSSTESLTSCKIDCEKVCGNGICEFGEGTDTCSQDCGVSN